MLLAKCLLIDGLAVIWVNICLFCYFVIYMLNLSESHYFPCNLKNRCLHTTLLKQSVNKACPEDKAMPLLCLFPPHHANGAEVMLVVHEEHFSLYVPSATPAAGSSLKFVIWRILVRTRYLLAGGIFRRF